MKKETFYFSHDYTTRSDEKIKKLLYQHGMEGYGIYWALIEDLYQNDNQLEKDYNRISYQMHCTTTMLESIVEDFELFEISEETFGSASVKRRLEMRDAKTKVASKNASKRWKENNVAMQTDLLGNAIKESKGKDIKLDTSKLLKVYNDILGKKSRVVPEKAKKQLKARLSEGYTKDDIVKALNNASKDSFHMESRYKYLTLEFITRSDKLEKFVNMSDFKIKEVRI